MLHMRPLTGTPTAWRYSIALAVAACLALAAVPVCAVTLQQGLANASAAEPGCPGKCRCATWGLGLQGCRSSRFDASSQTWLDPRPELSDGPRAVWQQRHETDVANLRSAAAAGTCDVVLLGDSITERWNRPSFSERRYLKEWDCVGCGAAPPLRRGVLTFAIGGDRIQDLAWRLFSGGGIEELKACAPKQVSLMIGTNDYGSNEEVGVAELELRLLAAQLSAALPPSTRLLLQPPFARGDDPDHAWGPVDWDPLRHNQLRDVLQYQAVGNTSAYVLDCTDMITLPGSGDGSTGAFEQDLLHLSKQGYLLWDSCMSSRCGVKILA